MLFMKNILMTEKCFWNCIEGKKIQISYPQLLKKKKIGIKRKLTDPCRESGFFWLWEHTWPSCIATESCRLRAANAHSQLSSAGRGHAAVGLIPSSGLHLSYKKEMSLFCSKLNATSTKCQGLLQAMEDTRQSNLDPALEEFDFSLPICSFTHHNLIWLLLPPVAQ